MGLTAAIPGVMGAVKKGIGGLMKPQIQTRGGSNQATGLTTDVMDMMRKQITGGTFGSGFGPLQQQAGTGIQQFVNSGGGQFDLSPLFANLMKMHGQANEEGVANLNENFSMMGGRMGTGLAREQGRFLSDSNAKFGAQIGEISRQEFGNQQNRLLQGLSMMQEFGNQNTNPFLQMAQQGIVNPTHIVGDSQMSQISGLMAGLGALINGSKNMGGKGG